ncbi:hypothetical protein EO98_09965 [Methanosarcina sp. 2.H.T.1A.6]|uniref:hypothetical protein n=1 Tax=unclassified Methanosarcina TaxID=2644672 RepID=UPI000620F7EC|nr:MULTISPECIES: hypothetical protein [unclassified Methanosarcina]KKG14279.1 hypothetical protein EO94_16350 [Methanosarcina sp. 2.H.T.1A.3]KKG16952.1 hypothetical protein EO97_18895 [Methanosarcina sp. 2.H.T.1A.15]KKG19769.1 hypothetical protein EO98_09965 [Methanosarcina sp. 2.H.T.1A.6]KKG27156.1 hypothetical protein EO96_09370 [Methanosarcina sp. 2.H.T.1A.8]
MAENAAIKKIVLSALVLAVVLSSFYVLDFKAARSETLANSVVSAYSTGDPQIDFPGRIYLYVEGDDFILKSLTESLGDELEKSGMEVLVVDSVEEKYDSQTLLVNLTESEGLYTPVYASSDLNILFFYTSTGEDTKYFEQFKEGNVTVAFVNTGSPEGEKLVRGDLELQDSTKGIVSQKAHRMHLAEEAARKTVEQLQQQISVFP